MGNEATQKYLDILKKIEESLDEVRGFFPDIPKQENKIVSKKYADPLRVLRKVDRIIMNYNFDNAERKLRSLLGFLNTTLTKVHRNLVDSPDI